jgi:hypothetical protein
MNTSLIEIRRAEAPDALALASIHNDAWRNAYQGIIPGPELDKLINRRGGKWWDGGGRSSKASASAAGCSRRPGVTSLRARFAASWRVGRQVPL